MSMRLLSRTIYGTERCLGPLSAPCAGRSVTCTERLRSCLSQAHSVHVATASMCTPRHPTVYCHHGHPTRGSVTICTYHRLSTYLLRGTAGHIALTPTHVPWTPSPKHASRGTRFMALSISPPLDHQFSPISVCRKAVGWICQHASSLYQQRRTYAKKGWGYSE